MPRRSRVPSQSQETGQGTQASCKRHLQPPPNCPRSRTQTRKANATYLGSGEEDPAACTRDAATARPAPDKPTMAFKPPSGTLAYRQHPPPSRDTRATGTATTPAPRPQSAPERPDSPAGHAPARGRPAGHAPTDHAPYRPHPRTRTPRRPRPCASTSHRPRLRPRPRTRTPRLHVAALDPQGDHVPPARLRNPRGRGEGAVTLP